MVFQPGQSGNPGGQANQKIWRDALRRAVLRKADGEDKQAIEKLADKCLRMAMEGDVVAMKEIGNRMDGMPVQALANDPDNPLIPAGATEPEIDERITKLEQLLAQGGEAGAASGKD